MTKDELMEHPYYERAKKIKTDYMSGGNISIEYIVKFMEEWDKTVDRIKKHGK